MDVLNSKPGELTHYGQLLRAQGHQPPVMGPNMFDELQSNINRQWHHCAHAADKADNPVPPDVYHMLKNHGDSQCTRRTGQPHQHRLGRLVHRVSYARVKRIVRMTDPYAAAQMALRGMPGALACLSATGGDNATSLNDGEMAHLLRDLAGIDPRGTAPGLDGRTPPCADCRTDQVVNARHSVWRARRCHTHPHSHHAVARRGNRSVRLDIQLHAWHGALGRQDPRRQRQICRPGVHPRRQNRARRRATGRRPSGQSVGTTGCSDRARVPSPFL